MKWKQQVLNREIDLEEIDAAAFRDRFGSNMAKIQPGVLVAA